jgi:hypothetical protein
VKIYYFLFEVAPDEHFKESGGAFVNCWIRSDSKREAERIAKRAIRNDGWYIHSLHDSFIAEKDRYADDPVKATFSTYGHQNLKKKTQVTR